MWTGSVPSTLPSSSGEMTIPVSVVWVDIVVGGGKYEPAKASAASGRFLLGAEGIAGHRGGRTETETPDDGGTMDEVREEFNEVADDDDDDDLLRFDDDDIQYPVDGGPTEMAWSTRSSVALAAEVHATPTAAPTLARVGGRTLAPRTMSLPREKEAGSGEGRETRRRGEAGR